MKKRHELHAGERRLHERRATPAALSEAMPGYIDRDMHRQCADFLAALPYLPLAALDAQERPWATLLITRSQSDPTVGIRITGQNITEVTADTHPHDPFARALQQALDSGIHTSHLFAGVGIDFSSRRRNKLAGSLQPRSIDPAGRVRLQLHSDQHLGNCPKYITVREVRHEPRQAELILDQPDSLTATLPEAARALLARASTVFLATKHSIDKHGGSVDQADMGFNHRGGAPGFVRLLEERNGDQVTTWLVLPDHSGNRFYQSLGNIETDRQVGLLVPDFATGDVLQVTGDAENLYDDEAEALMPRVSLLTRIRLTGAVFVKAGLNLHLVGDEQLSPYNPPVKYLRRELEELGHAIVDSSSGDTVNATLVSHQTLSESISTFTFALSSPIESPTPGGFGVFDFSAMLDTGYSHMNEALPQLVNEDFIRTWTLTSTSAFDAHEGHFLPVEQVSVTVKRKPGGLISTLLHQYDKLGMEHPLKLTLRGTGGDFSCITPDPQGLPPDVPENMLWIAGGVGITPFMAMWDALQALANSLENPPPADIVLVFSGRNDDISVLRHFLRHEQRQQAPLKLRILAFQSVAGDMSRASAAREALLSEAGDATLVVKTGRVTRQNLEAIDGLVSRQIYLCGPDGLMEWHKRTLTEIGIRDSQLHQESFFF